jgi:hypothetical protein
MVAFHAWASVASGWGIDVASHLVLTWIGRRWLLFFNAVMSNRIR